MSWDKINEIIAYLGPRRWQKGWRLPDTGKRKGPLPASASLGHRDKEKK